MVFRGRISESGLVRRSEIMIFFVGEKTADVLGVKTTVKVLVFVVAYSAHNFTLKTALMLVPKCHLR